MPADGIKIQFDMVADQYDSQRRRFIPCFDDYYITMTGFISASIQKPDKILDLGAGTGLLTKYLYDKFPDSKYTLVDLSEQMLDVAKRRFRGLGNFKFFATDYSKSLPDERYDLIMSALSIHHLENGDKERLYQMIYEELPSDGVFVNFDQFRPISATMNKLYNKWWYQAVEKSGLPRIEYEKWLKRREFDRENTVEETLAIMRHAGFSTAECIYSYMKFGVIFAIK